MAADGATTLRLGGSTCGVWALNTSSGPSRRDSPPAQGNTGRRTQILGALPAPKIQEQIVAVVAVDVRVTMLHKFQQAFLSEWRCSRVPVHRQSFGHCRYATETGTHSAVLCRTWEAP